MRPIRPEGRARCGPENQRCRPESQGPGRVIVRVLLEQVLVGWASRKRLTHPTNTPAAKGENFGFPSSAYSGIADFASLDTCRNPDLSPWSSPQKVSAGLRITRTFHTRPETGSPGPNDAAHGCKTLRCTRTHSLAPPLDSDSPHRGSTPSSTRRKNFPSARCPSSCLAGSCYR